MREWFTGTRITDILITSMDTITTTLAALIRAIRTATVVTKTEATTDHMEVIMAQMEVITEEEVKTQSGHTQTATTQLR